MNTFTGKEVADHIKYITPEESDIPDYFISKYILPNDGWKNTPIKLKDLLKSSTNINTKKLSCLITSDHHIHIGNYVFWDWEDTEEMRKDLK